MRARKIDANQPAIVKALRGMGCTVHYIMEPVDLMVGFKGRTVAMEVKNPDESWGLTKQQRKFFKEWEGEAYIVEDEGQALRAILGQEIKEAPKEKWRGKRDPVYGTPWRG